jgi:glutamine amidotransferase
MCELFAMSSTVPATVNYSLERFARHGGLTHANRDGWGISYFEQGDVRLIKEPTPASDSPWVRFIAERNLQSHCVIAHVRWATQGGAALENTHPFERELGGRRHVFAHNGSLNEVERALPFESGRFRPIGATDSEHAFCVLLQRLAPLWDGAAVAPALEARLETVARFAAEAKALGAANFLYSDGEVLFAHGHRRRYEEKGRMTEPRPPGLHMLCQRCAGADPEVVCDGLTVSVPEREVVLLASVPLTDGPWVPLPEGAVVALEAGREVARVVP